MVQLVRSFVQQLHLRDGGVEQADDLLDVRTNGCVGVCDTLLLLVFESYVLIFKLLYDQVLTVVPQVGVCENVRGRRHSSELGKSSVTLLFPSPGIRAIQVPRVLPYLIPNDKLVKLISRLLQEIVERKVECLVRQVQPLKRRVEVFALGVPELALDASKGRPDPTRLILVLSDLEKVGFDRLEPVSTLQILPHLSLQRRHGHLGQLRRWCLL